MRTAPRFPLVLLACLSAIGCDVGSADPLALQVNGFEVVGGEVPDGAIQAGEEATVSLFLLNPTAARVSEVRIEVAAGAGVTALSDGFAIGGGFGFPTASFDPDESERAFIHFRADRELAVGTPLRFDVTLTDSLGASMAVPIEFAVAPMPYRPTLVSHEIDDDSDGDGQLEPGETAVLRFVVGSEPSGASPCIGDRVTTPLAEVTFSGATGTQCQSYPDRLVRFRLASTVSPGSVVPFRIELLDPLGNAYGYDVAVPVM